MKIIIPMAGESRRFKEAGYDIPKPFLPIDGRPMIHWVCSMFDPEDEFIFIVREEHADSSKYRPILEKAARNSIIVPITPHTQGPIVSSLAAAKFAPTSITPPKSFPIKLSPARFAPEKSTLVSFVSVKS